MNALFTYPELPEIPSPTIVRPEDFRLVLKTYHLWLHRAIEQKSKQEHATKFIRLVRDVNMLQNTPLPNRMSAMTTSRLIDFSRFHFHLKEFHKPLGDDFLPLMELVADAHFLFAETADFVLRYVRSHPPKNGLPPFFDKALDQTLGISSLEAVETEYRFAFDLYTSWLSRIYDIMEETPHDDLSRSQNISLETITGRLSLTLSRLLLIQMTNWLESHTELRFDIASGLRVLPHLAIYPEARNTLKKWHKEIDLAHSTIDILFQLESGFNDAQTVMTVFENMAIFAITVGAYEWAKNALTIAKQAADVDHLSMIQKNLHLAIDLERACQIH